jgi:methionyl-tRNA synthetase
VFRELLAVLHASGVALYPFMPQRMETMLAHLGFGAFSLDDVPLAKVGAAGLKPPPPLFPRIQGDPADLLKA